MANGSENQDGKQGKGLSPQALISFFVRNEAAHKAMKRRTVIDSNNEEHEAVTVSWNWRDTWQEEHKRAFVVAKMVKADLLADVHGSLQKALDEGVPFEQWRKQIVPKLEGKWLGKTVGQLWDELSDEEKAKREPPTEEQREKVIAPKRLELIFRTNMAVANAAGHYSQLMKTKDIYPYWRYVTRDDARVRTSHRALHNKVYKWDDPFWATFFPPNGFRCRCHVSPMTKRQVERDPMLHIEQSTIAEDADGRKVLDVGGYYYKNNPGWDYNPGDSINHLERLAKDNTKGRPAQVQADLEADLAKRDAEEAAVAKPRETREEATQTEAERQIVNSKNNNHINPPKNNKFVSKANNPLLKSEDGLFKESEKENSNKRPPKLDTNSDEYKKRFITAWEGLKNRNECDDKTKEEGKRILGQLIAYDELPVGYTESWIYVSSEGNAAIVFNQPTYDNIQQARQTLKNYEFEHVIIYDTAGNPYQEVSSADKGHVVIPEDEKYAGGTALHNHPGDHFYSWEDFRATTYRDLKCVELICHSNGFYSCCPPKNLHINGFVNDDIRNLSVAHWLMSSAISTLTPTLNIKDKETIMLNSLPIEFRKYFSIISQQ